MNELCTLLNRSCPSFLQEVFSKVMPSARREMHIISERAQKGYIHFGIKFHCLGGILCIPQGVHSF